MKKKVVIACIASFILGIWFLTCRARFANGQTFLMEASKESSATLVKTLLLAGADVNAKNSHGDTALFYASLEGGPKIVELLLNAGADTTVKDTDRWSALYYATYFANGDPHSMEILLNHEADKQAAATVALRYLGDSWNRSAKAELLIRTGANASSKDVNGDPLLLMYAREGFDDVVRVLCEQGHANVDIASDIGRTPLMQAAAEWEVETVSTLLELGADCSRRDHSGARAIDLVTKGGTVEPGSFGRSRSLEDKEKIIALLKTCSAGIR